MFITLPLALIGVGFMIYLLFAAATYVLSRSRTTVVTAAGTGTAGCGYPLGQ